MARRGGDRPLLHSLHKQDGHRHASRADHDEDGLLRLLISRAGYPQGKLNRAAFLLAQQIEGYGLKGPGAAQGRQGNLYQSQ